MKNKYSDIQAVPFSIIGHGIAFPPDKGEFVTNEGLPYSNLSQEELPAIMTKVEQLGFKNRFIANKETTSVDLMVDALKNAMQGSVECDEIDFLITITTTSPRYTTSTSAMVSEACNLSCPSFEMKTGCASSIYAIHVASQLLSRQTKVVAIAFGETLSKTVPLNHKAAYAVGDGGAALILRYEEGLDKGIVWSSLGLDGKYYSKMGVPGILPPRQEDLDAGKYYMYYDSSVNNFLETKWQELAKLIHEKVDIHKIDKVLMHQANNRMIQVFSEALGTTNIQDTISSYANCGTVSIIAGLSNFLNGNLNPDTNIILAAVGGGVSFGTMQIRI